MAFSAYFHWQDLLLGSHLDFPEFILMAVSFRFIHNLEAAIKDKEGCSSSLGKIWRGDFFGGEVGGKPCWKSF